MYKIFKKNCIKSFNDSAFLFEILSRLRSNCIRGLSCCPRARCFLRLKNAQSILEISWDGIWTHLTPRTMAVQPRVSTKNLLQHCFEIDLKKYETSKVLEFYSFQIKYFTLTHVEDCFEIDNLWPIVKNIFLNWQLIF